MNNKRNAIIVTLFIAAIFLIAAVLGIAEHIPLIGKAIALIIAAVLVIFVILFFIAIKRRK